ncbi:hypothetical protein MMC18_000919 [Xylographa bjoerkii]|nr:hypothetical protein [Xylographa bjoerkii]
MAKRSSHHQQKPGRKARAAASNSIIKSAQLPTPISFRRWKSTTTHHAPGFWDLLTSSGINISLTKRALQEFDRRNAEEAPKTPIQKVFSQEYFPLDIKRFSRHANYSDLRGYPEPASFDMAPDRRKTRSVSNNLPMNSGDAASTSRGVTKPTTKTTKSGRSSAYDANFMSLLISNGVDRPQREKQPANYDQLRDRLAERRDSLSPVQFSESDYKNFLTAVDNAHDEGQVMTDVFSVIKGPKSYPSTTNRPCNNWVPLISEELVTPQPDFYYGEVHSRRDVDLRRTLDGLIVPSRASEAPFLPNFFVEVKRPGGSAEVARRAAIYDAALGARAMHHLQAYGAEEAYDNKAYTFTSTYIDGSLEIFAHHMSPPDESRKLPSHHTVSFDRWPLNRNINEFRSGVTAFRNARDQAREFRESFIAEANNRMDLLLPEVREHKIAQASARMREILDRNTSEESSPAIASSPLANTSELQTPLEQDDAGENQVRVRATATRQAKKQAANRLDLLKQATKRKPDHELVANKGPKTRRKKAIKK